MSTKHISKKFFLLSAFSAAALIAACGGGGGYGASGSYSAKQGTLHMSMTDAPACGFDQVNVTVNKVRVNQSASASETDSGWQEITLSPAKKINLLALTNGVMTDLGQTTLPAGHYTQIRLVLDANGSAAPWANSVVATGTTTEVALDTPSAIQSGIKLTNEFDVAADTVTDLALDFDACKSIVAKGNGGFSLKPVISVIPVTTSGSISGYVAPGLTNPVVTVQQDGVVLKGTVPDAVTGAFTLSPVTPSGSANYVVVVTADAHATAAIGNVPVTVGTATALSTSAVPITLPVSVTHTVSGTVTPVLASGSVRATQTFATGSQKIEVAFQAADLITGAYSLTLPAASPLLGSFGTLPITLTADSTITGKYSVEASATGYTTQTSAADVSASDVTKSFVLVP